MQAHSLPPLRLPPLALRRPAPPELPDLEDQPVLDQHQRALLLRFQAQERQLERLVQELSEVALPSW